MSPGLYSLGGDLHIDERTNGTLRWHLRVATVRTRGQAAERAALSVRRSGHRDEQNSLTLSGLEWIADVGYEQVDCSANGNILE